MKWHVGQEAVTSNDFYGTVTHCIPECVAIRFCDSETGTKYGYFNYDGSPRSGYEKYGFAMPRASWKESTGILALPLTFAAGILYGWLQWG